MGPRSGCASDHRICWPALRTEETTSRTAWVVAPAYFFSKISDACLAPSIVRWELLVDKVASLFCAASCGVGFGAGGEDDQRLVAEVGEQSGLLPGGVGLGELVDPARRVVGGGGAGQHVGSWNVATLQQRV